LREYRAHNGRKESELPAKMNAITQSIGQRLNIVPHNICTRGTAEEKYQCGAKLPRQKKWRHK
jgi:hypothetical protein